MSRILDIHASETHAEAAVLRTCEAYEATAEDYAEATKDFKDYPGLRDALLDFVVGSPSSQPILDIGCGGGRDARLLAGEGRSVVAGDICMAMLDCARRRSTDNQYATLKYVRLNALALPFSDAQFAGAWASGSLLHLPLADIPDALSEVWRTLAPGGVAALSMRAGKGEGWRDGGTLSGRRWFTLVDPQEFTADMERAGFSAVKIHFIGRHDWFIAHGRK